MNRNATRTTLYALGFRQIEAVGTLDAFWNLVRKRPPDLALVEAQPDRDVCDAIQHLRTGAAGHNPFIVVIVTAWDNTNGLVGRVINSGADDLVLRPFSTATLGTRIKSHIERRKGFVITTDYVGPDRRKDGNRPSDVDLFEPPNSLKMKARDRMSPEQVAQRLDAELKVACDILHSEKLRRDSFQVCILWRLIQAQLPAHALTNSDVQKLRHLAASIETRCQELQIEHAGEWCQSILAAVEGIEMGVDRNASMHLLGHAALSLNQLFSPEKSTQEHLTQIDATVAIILARAEPAMAS
ncbi:MAG TPA: response regulator [Rhizomicrobium sp.]|nr:response regulator [Rhizomicrobium sp.]